MKLEYLKDGSDDCPLIRIYESSQQDYLKLLEAINLLVNGTKISIDIDELSGCIPINNLKLKFVLASNDDGVVGIRDDFKCLLSKERWSNVKELIAPFLKESKNRFQWLDESSNISLLLSDNGQW